MPASRTCTVTRAARRMKRRNSTPTRRRKSTANVRYTAAGIDSGRKWLIHLAATPGTSSSIASSNVPRRAPMTISPDSITSVNSTVLISSPLGKRSEEHTSELQSRPHLVCRLLLEKKKKNTITHQIQKKKKKKKQQTI